MKVLIRPKKLNGVIDVVPSKSYSHRAIIAASLSKGRSVIKNVLFSDDINRTIACYISRIQALGYASLSESISYRIVINMIS